jgi:hypothetical protein
VPLKPGVCLGTYEVLRLIGVGRCRLWANQGGGPILDDRQRYTLIDRAFEQQHAAVRRHIKRRSPNRHHGNLDGHARGVAFEAGL